MNFSKRLIQMRNIVDLPEELLIEILSRVPAVSLTRLRSTCKRWNALIKDARFTKKHFVNAPRQSLVIMLMGFRLYSVILGDNDYEVTSKFSLKDPLSNYKEEVDIRHVFHCDGLLLCTTEDKRLVVWNPCSGETSWINFRISNKKLDWFALGRSSGNKYKILRVEQHVNSYMNPQAEYEIYDLTSKSWRVVGETRDWCIPGVWYGGMSVNGNTYWLAIGFPENMDILVSFDFSSERFVIDSLPCENLYDQVLALSVSREEQQLCMLAATHLDINVWMATKLESNGAATWSKFLTVKGAERNQFGLTCVNGMNFLADPEKKVLVCPGGGPRLSKSFLHILEEDKHIKVDHHDDAGTKCSLLLSYVPSMVQIEQVS